MAYLWFHKIKSLELDGSTPLQTAIRTRFTIIVPFRNEAANLPLLLDSISKYITQRNGLKLFWSMMNRRKYSVLTVHCSIFEL
jgi:hypothetical protein